ncbi:ADP-ribosyl-[dinitrogen reductase] hydrolase [Methylotetracoccus oryzae]|uniref:ADP-ribosyl-[dinitrogen reductase] hydrolase n=1 Tax=Methylotetracoccus oryzae TaxID=1919059 RepID=UPI00111A15C9|nr:ADP-ribosyl-[dinitrogen reductase] hydrolase [Methylotetracoccus oryzae]
MPEPDLPLRRRALGAYLGLAIGDALGATVEYLTPEEIRERHGIHDRMIGGGWLELKPGQVTDATEMSLALAQALIAHGGWDLKSVADGFVDWFRARPVDVGRACRRGITRYLLHGTVAGLVNVRDAGSAACVRNLPLVLLNLDDESRLMAQTLQQSHITHNNPYSDAATQAVALMALALLHGRGLAACQGIANWLVAAHPAFRFDPYPGRASGYVVETFQTVCHFVFTTDSFESCVTGAVNRGQAAGTVGALAGMLAGAHYGAAAIPHRWLERLDTEVKSRILEQTRALLQLGLPDRSPAPP